MGQNAFKSILRNIRQNPGYTTINILGLAVGMACCLLILLYVQDEFSYDGYPVHPERIYRIVSDIASADRGDVSTARTPPAWGPVLLNELPEVESYVRLKTPLVSWLVAYEPGNRKFHEKGFFFADSSVFSFFNLPLVRGNPKTALQEPGSVVLSEEMARKYFGDDDPVGKQLRLDNAYTFRITGVMANFPRNSHFHCGFLASFTTLHTEGSSPYGNEYGLNMQQWFPDLYTYIRLRNGIEPAALEDKLSAFVDKHIGATLSQMNARYTAGLQPLRDIHLRSNREAEIQANSDIAYVYIFSAIALFVLIIACINFMNLATARSASRSREVGLRKVAGAHRGQLMLLFLGESLLMATLSLIVAIGLVVVLLPVFNGLAGKQLALTEFGSSLLPVAAGIVAFVGLGAGFYPAIFLSAFEPAHVLKGASRHIASSGGKLRKTLVVVQFAISVALIVGTWIVSDQMKFVQTRNLGFQKEHVVMLNFGDPSMRGIYNTYRNLILQDPNVLSASGMMSPPGGLINSISFRPEGAPETESIIMDWMIVDFDFLQTLNVEVLEGRGFSRTFPSDSTLAYMLNESAVQALGWQDPVGKKIDFGPQADFNPEIIGVVKDFHVKSLYSRVEPLAISLFFQPLHLAVRIAPNNIEQTLGVLEDRWREVYPRDPFQYSFLDEDFDSLYRSEELRGRIFTIFSVLAVFIACLGLLGLASFTAERRTKEIGIRKVLGASIAGIVMQLTGEFVKLVVIASLISWPIAYFIMENWLSNFAYRTNVSPGIFGLSALMAIAITVLTVSYQAVRAASTNPIESLQQE